MRNNLGQTLYHDDPYFDINPYWRESSINDIKNAVYRNPCTYVSGKSGVGKSWMLKRVSEDLMIDGHFVVYYRLPRKCVSIGQAVEGIANRFATNTKTTTKQKLDINKAMRLLEIWGLFFMQWGARILQMPDPSSAAKKTAGVVIPSIARFNTPQYEIDAIEIFNEHLSEFATCLKDANKYLIVILDQLERINKEKRSYLNDIAQNCPNRVKYIFSSYYPREQIFDYAVTQQFCPRPIDITDFTQEEIQKLLQKNFHTNKQEMEWMLKYASGSTERAGHCIRLRKRCGKFTHEDIRYIEDQYCKDQIERVRKGATEECLKALWYIAVVGERDCPSVGHLCKYLDLRDSSFRNSIIGNPIIKDLLVTIETESSRRRTICFGFRNDHIQQCFKKDAEIYSADILAGNYGRGDNTYAGRSNSTRRSTGEITKIYNSATSYYLDVLSEPNEHSLNELIFATNEVPHYAAQTGSPILIEYLDSFIEFKLKNGNVDEAKAELESTIGMLAQQEDIVRNINTLVRLSDICIQQEQPDMVNQISLSISELAWPITSADEQQKAVYEQALGHNDMQREEFEVASVQAYVGGIKYPAAKQQLIDLAQKNQAPDVVLEILDGVHNKSFKSPADISKDIGRFS